MGAVIEAGPMSSAEPLTVHLTCLGFSEEGSSPSLT